MTGDIPNWNLEHKGEDGYSWRNTETHTELAVIYEDEADSWVVTGQNSRLKKVDSKEDGYEYAVDYMYDHPRPSAML